jgi:dTMP kinase
MSTSTERGLFIVFEGIDGAGKTTQVGLLQQFLVGVGLTVVRSKEPTDGHWGKIIRGSATTGRLSLPDELNAFTQDRVEHVRDLIAPALARGDVVLLDRYFYSTIAYQGIRGADVQAVTARQLKLFPAPDVVLLLDVPAEVGVERVRSGRGETPNEFEGTENLRRCRQMFMEMIPQHPNMRRIDATASIPHIQAQVLSELVRGALRQRYCAKGYGCEEPMMCGYRLSKTCKWAQIAAAASVTT